MKVPDIKQIKIGDKVTFPDGKLYIAVSQGESESGEVVAIGFLPCEEGAQDE